MSAKDVMAGKQAKGKFAPQGTPLSGYEEHGPYHCADCRHRTAPDEPYCIHPVILADPKLKDKRQTINGRKVVKVNMERGCCEFVSQPKEHDEDED